MNFHELSAMDNQGEMVDFAEYEGMVVLVVNTATRCGYTSQYEGLQSLYHNYVEKGFEVLDFPCNQFLGQAPGTAEEIAEFCQLNYNTTFKQFEKVKVNGPQTHPVFKFLKEHQKGMIKWNFTKFLVDREGNVVKRYGSEVDPHDIAEDIENL